MVLELWVIKVCVFLLSLYADGQKMEKQNFCDTVISEQKVI